MNNYHTLATPSDFVVTGGSVELIGEVDVAVKEINSRRPLSSTVTDSIQKHILADRVHSSAVTEGNRLSRRETLVVLTAGVVEAGARLDTLEVRNLGEALLAVEDALENNDRFTPILLRRLHQKLLRGIDDDCAGDYRREDVVIAGATLAPMKCYDVSDAVESALARVESSPSDIHPVQLAAWLHWVVARIHPFKDGNGRIARLVQDYVLLRANYVPAPLRPEDREGAYYDALEDADLGNPRAFLELVAKNTLRMADRYLAIIRETEQKQSWLDGIVKVATEKVRQTDHRRFLNVQRSLNLIKSEFSYLSEELREHMPFLELHLRDYGSLDFDQFQDLEAQGRAKHTWLFGLDFRIETSALRYIFWYAVHRPKPSDVEMILPSKIILLVSEEEEERFYTVLDDLDEHRVTVREIVPAGGRFWRRRYDPVVGADTWDEEISAGQIARDFFQEVFGKLGLS